VDGHQLMELDAQQLYTDVQMTAMGAQPDFYVQLTHQRLYAFAELPRFED
jgi:hypothetical protein